MGDVFRQNMIDFSYHILICSIILILPALRNDNKPSTTSSWQDGSDILPPRSYVISPLFRGIKITVTAEPSKTEIRWPTLGNWRNSIIIYWNKSEIISNNISLYSFNSIWYYCSMPWSFFCENEEFCVALASSDEFLVIIGLVLLLDVSSGQSVVQGHWVRRHQFRWDK